MPKHALSFIELHNPVFMQGVNLGNKVNAAQRGAKLVQDDERGVVWIYYKNKLSFIPLSNIASADVVEMPEDIKKLFEVEVTKAQEQTYPPAIAAARRGRPPSQPNPPTAGLSLSQFGDPNDPDEAAAHRARVRLASANANKPQPLPAQNDLLIQEARMQAAGIKTSAQVSNPTKPSEGLTGVQGKPKAISHAQLKTQVAKEMKQNPNDV